MADLAMLLADGKYSDLVLKCQGREFKVHRNIICAQSPVFAAAIDGNFKESITNAIEVTEFESETVKLMLDFLYTGDYKFQCTAIAAPDDEGKDVAIPDQNPEDVSLARAEGELIPNIKVNAIGNYYQVLKLAELATSKIEDLLENRDLLIPPTLLSYVITQTFELSRDALLHEIVTAAAANGIADLVPCDEFRNLEGIGDIGLAIMERLDTKIDVLNTRIGEGKQREMALEATVRSKDTLLKALGRITKCRWCRARFNCFVEKNTDGPEADSHFLRCTDCKVKNFGK